MVVRAPLKIRSRRPTPAWPPSAEPQGIDLSLVAVLLIAGGLTYLGYLYVWAAPTDQGPGPYIRWQVVGQLVELLVWLGVVGWLGWRKAAGLVVGSLSWWGVLPLVALGAASVAASGLAEEAWVGPGLQLAVGVGVLMGALTEEVVFRGFLYHGLTRRLGGILAMASSSLLFAVYHVPRMVREGDGGEEMIVKLITHFLFGMYLCRVRAQTGSVWFPTAIHTLWNLTTVEIAVWAIPDATFPTSFASIRLTMDLVSLLIAFGLVVRASLAHDARRYVSGPPVGNHGLGRGARPADFRSVYGALAQSPSPAVFERLTDRACRAVDLAQEEARTAGAKTVGTEHLLIALVHESDGAASEALRECRIQPGSSTRLEELFAERGEGAAIIPFDTRAKWALQLAALEADAWGHPRIGTDHLLIGLTALRRTEAARILRRQKISPEWLRKTTLRLLAERTGFAPAGADPA